MKYEIIITVNGKDLTVLETEEKSIAKGLFDKLKAQGATVTCKWHSLTGEIVRLIR